nr:hypothetical protein [Tanacetum cinerariifolium]
MSYLSNFKEFNRGYVTFGGGANGGRITGKGTIHTATKDETLGILKKFITETENLIDKKVKNATNDEPQSSCDTENKDDNGVNKDSGIDDHEKSANKDDNGVNKDDVQKGVIDRMYACLMNQHDETMSPLVLVLMYKKLSLQAAKELEDNGVFDTVEHLGVICSKILAVLDSFPRGMLTFVLTFPIGDLDSEATVPLRGVATD